MRLVWYVVLFCAIFLWFLSFISAFLWLKLLVHIMSVFQQQNVIQFLLLTVGWMDLAWMPARYIIAVKFFKRQWFSYSLDCKAVATRRIPDTYKPKPNPYLNANPNPNPNPTNPTSILSKFSRKNFTLHTV